MLAALAEPLERQNHLLPSGFSAADAVDGHLLWSLSRFLELPPPLRDDFELLQARPSFQKALSSPGG